tara:strand:+ start:1457 stop:1765 length:309 start_codon:yes stop_codon:yes gene_type:complete
VTSIEIALLTAIIALATMIQIYAAFKISQISTSAVVSSIQQLDGAIAEAISSVVEQGIGNFEPPNPLVAILADVMRSNLDRPTAEVQVLDRSGDGKFIKKEE